MNEDRQLRIVDLSESESDQTPAFSKYEYLHTSYDPDLNIDYCDGGKISKKPQAQ